VSIRYGRSWRTGHGGRSWVSMPLWVWLIAWLAAAPFLILWLAVWLLVHLIVGLARGAVWTARRIHGAPAVPAALKTPPRRRP
jgi:hypothetical protein